MYMEEHIFFHCSVQRMVILFTITVHKMMKQQCLVTNFQFSSKIFNLIRAHWASTAGEQLDKVSKHSSSMDCVGEMLKIHLFLALIFIKYRCKLTFSQPTVPLRYTPHQ